MAGERRGALPDNSFSSSEEKGKLQGRGKKEVLPWNFFVRIREKPTLKSLPRPIEVNPLARAGEGFDQEEKENGEGWPVNPRDAVGPGGEKHAFTEVEETLGKK